MFEIRGVTQVLETALSYSMSVTNSDIGGIGHILLEISQVLVLMQIIHNVFAAKV